MLFPLLSVPRLISTGCQPILLISVMASVCWEGRLGQWPPKNVPCFFSFQFSSLQTFLSGSEQYLLTLPVKVAVSLGKAQLSLLPSMPTVRSRSRFSPEHHTLEHSVVGALISRQFSEMVSLSSGSKLPPRHPLPLFLTVEPLGSQ